MVFQAYGTYDASFYLGGLMFVIGACCHLTLHLPCVKRMSAKNMTGETVDLPLNSEKYVSKDKMTPV